MHRSVSTKQPTGGHSWRESLTLTQRCPSWQLLSSKPHAGLASEPMGKVGWRQVTRLPDHLASCFRLHVPETPLMHASERHES